MSFRVLSTFESDNYFQSKVSPKRLPPQESVQHLLFQLEYDELSDPHFQQSRKHLRAGHEMRAIQDCCSPFNFGPRVSRSGLYVKFDHAGLLFLRIPATLSTKIVVEDQQNGFHKTHFDIRFGSEGMYDLMRWLTQKARAYEAKVFRRQRKSSRRAEAQKTTVSRVRQRLAVKVLIRNAERIEENLLQRSIESD